MTEERKRELEQLLAEAMTSLEIRHSGIESSLLPVEVYRTLLQRRWTSRSDDSLILMGRFDPHIVNKAIESKLLNFIRQEFAPFIHEDKILSACCFFSAHPGAGYPLTDLLGQLLNIAIVRGTEKAVLAFARCTKDTHGSVQYTALLEGIRLESEIQVFEGVRLVPLPASTADLPRYLPSLISHASRLSESFFCSKTLIIIDYFVSPIFYQPLRKATMQEYFKQKNHAFRVNVADVSENFCQVLSLACNSAVQIALEWRFLSAEELFNLNGLGVGGSNYRYNVNLSGSFTRVGESKIKEAKHLYQIWVNLDSNIGEKLQIPINRWIKSKASGNFVDKVIDLGIAFEALYVPDSGRGEIRFKLAVRAAWHLGKDKDDRNKLLTKFKQIYDYRSNAVHSGKLDEKVKFGGERIPISEFIEKAQDLCRKSIMKILEDRQYPDWNDLILGSEAENDTTVLGENPGGLE